MLLSLKEWRIRTARDASLRADLKDRIERILRLGPDDVASVSEIACFNPGCPDCETVVLLMRSGERTCALKIPKSMGDVTDADIQSLSAEAA